MHKGDLVIDIGSNDSTTLQAYPSSGPDLVGIDPTGIKFHSYYPPHIQLIPDFFSSILCIDSFGSTLNRPFHHRTGGVPRRRCAAITLGGGALAGVDFVPVPQRLLDFVAPDAGSRSISCRDPRLR